MNYDKEQLQPDDSMTFEEWIDSKDGPLHAAYLKACSRLQGSAAPTPAQGLNDEHQ